MNNQFEFVTQHSSSSTEANIFFHGYSAGHNKKDRKTLLESIPGNFSQHTNIFAFWPSNHYAHLSSSSWWKLGNACLRQFVGTDSLSVQNMAPLVFHFAKDRIDDFAEARKRAELMGALLFIQLKDYLDKNHPHINTLNLIGHSLGGRLVISSLKNIRSKLPSHLSVKDVLLMAAAVEVRADEAKNMRNLIKGRLINAYSKSDWMLFVPWNEKCLGRNPVEHFENIPIDDFGHCEYWPKLAEVFSQTEFKGYSFHGCYMGVSVKASAIVHAIASSSILRFLIR